MKIIEQLLTGEIDITEFVNTLKVNPDLKETIKHLIPREAITDHKHVLWQTISFLGYERDDFDCLKHIQRICRFDGSIGDNLNLFGSIQRVYCALNPSFQYTTKYEDAFDLYLESVQDCFDGPDVSQVTESIIRNALDISTKAGRRKRAKAEIKEYFHADGKRPRWIQGPEWPMGKDSPMKFEKQIKTAKVHYMCLETLIQMKRR